MKLIRWCAWAAKDCSNNWLCFDRPRDSQGLGIARRCAVAKTGNDWPEMRSLNSPLRWGSSISRPLGSSNNFESVTLLMNCVALKARRTGSSSCCCLADISIWRPSRYPNYEMYAGTNFIPNRWWLYVRHLNFLAVLHARRADRILVGVLWASRPCYLHAGKKYSGYPCRVGR